MSFSVSSRGNVTVKTLCTIERTMNGEDKVGKNITVCALIILVFVITLVHD